MRGRRQGKRLSQRLSGVFGRLGRGRQQENKSEPLSGDRAIIDSGFPPLLTNVMLYIAQATGVGFGIRVGNPPRLGVGDQSKPMESRAFCLRGRQLVLHLEVKKVVNKKVVLTRKSKSPPQNLDLDNA